MIQDFLQYLRARTHPFGTRELDLMVEKPDKLEVSF